jgi:hypothetical protein
VAPLHAYRCEWPEASDGQDACTQGYKSLQALNVEQLGIAGFDTHARVNKPLRFEVSASDSHSDRGITGHFGSGNDPASSESLG